MSDLRVNIGVREICPHCGYHVRHVPLGADQPKPAERWAGDIALMRVSLSDRLIVDRRRPDVAA